MLNIICILRIVLLHGLSGQSSSAIASSGVNGPLYLKLESGQSTHISCSSAKLYDDPVESVEHPTLGGLTGLPDGGLCDISLPCDRCGIKCFQMCMGWAVSLEVLGRDGMLSQRSLLANGPKIINTMCRG